MSSEPGAQTRGPEAKPSTNKLVPRVVTSLDTPNSLLARLDPAAKIALLKDATNVPLQIATAMYNL